MTVFEPSWPTVGEFSPTCLVPCRSSSCRSVSSDVIRCCPVRFGVDGGCRIPVGPLWRRDSFGASSSDRISTSFNSDLRDEGGAARA